MLTLVAESAELTFNVSSAEAVTSLLQAWRAGDASAFSRLTPLVYGELHKLAGAYLRRQRPGHTLQPTALVHEAWIRLERASGVDWENRKHFLGIAARVMRQVLVQHARADLALKRGGGARHNPIDELAENAAVTCQGMVALDEALSELAVRDERKSKAIELHYFGGLTVEEIASLLETSESTVTRDLRMARAWLRKQVSR